MVKPTDKAKVILDVTLCDALYKGAIKKGSAYPTEIHKKDLGSAFLNCMQVHHKASRGTQEVIRKGAIRTIQIMTERRQGNKKMTRLLGSSVGSDGRAFLENLSPTAGRHREVSIRYAY